MTETYSAPPTADAIEDEPDTVSVELDRQADAFLRDHEGRSFGPTTSGRGAMREDAGAIGRRGRTRAEGLRQLLERHEREEHALDALLPDDPPEFARVAPRCVVDQHQRATRRKRRKQLLKRHVETQGCELERALARPQA